MNEACFLTVVFCDYRFEITLQPVRSALFAHILSIRKLINNKY
ncbi:MAG: hypothetical protein JWQ57_921 [Mucilaginibacter sp.]|nr:hypothetical protein [Mucilaginibacter sp.]